MKSISCGSHVPDSYFLSVEHKEEMRWSTERWAGWQGRISCGKGVSDSPSSSVLHTRTCCNVGATSEGAGGLQPDVPADLASGQWT